jgi:hypothetical protein
MPYGAVRCAPPFEFRTIRPGSSFICYMEALTSGEPKKNQEATACDLV